MAILGSIISDFLDKPIEKRREGTYSFENFERDYIYDTLKDHFDFIIRREPSTNASGLVDIFIPYLTIKEVFTPTKATNSTYVSRRTGEGSTYEASISLAFDEPGSTILLFGQSKLGKSALWRRLIDCDSESIQVSCTPTVTRQELYQQILFKLGEPYISDKTDRDAKSYESKKDGSVSIGKPGVIGVKIGESKSSTNAIEAEERFQYVDRPINADVVSELLSLKKKLLVFENYHRLNDEVFSEICYDIRTFADQKVTIIFVGIPSEPYEIIRNNSELEGRVLFMPFNLWSVEDLKKIALGGAEKLNISFDKHLLDFLATEAAGSPFLMQLYCFLACLASGITEAPSILTDVTITEDQFSKTINAYGIQFLSQCEQLLNQLVDTALKIENLPENFIDELTEKIKSDKPYHIIKICEFNKNNTKIDSIKSLIEHLNEIEIARGLLSLNQETEAICIGNPFFVSYIRWIHSTS